MIDTYVAQKQRNGLYEVILKHDPYVDLGVVHTELKIAWNRTKADADNMCANYNAIAKAQHEEAQQLKAAAKCPYLTTQFLALKAASRL